MLPENLARALDRPYVLLEGENLYLDHLSIPQINHYLRMMIHQVNQTSDMYDKIFKNRYYIILGTDEEEIDFVRGDFLLDFSVKLPSLGYMQEVVRLRGVPKEDVVATAIETELVFRKMLKLSIARLRRYFRCIKSVCDPLRATEETLFVLFDKLSEMKGLHEMKLRNSITEKHVLFLEMLLHEIRGQLEIITLVLAVRK
jgi:hypothetical protein